ncbi:hypothetical protein RR46_05059 [Papilio xuthus]|uniref:Uncharacterized protein n=1 Tax=Papilio xuthus TaxID=66420 RepID=A0A194QA29_PAPXU|nr:hypothetical protein RR46_05059 [Papilio xuthus]
MNCLNLQAAKKKVDIEEPNAPTYYPTQPPYNPQFVYDNFEHLRNKHTWGLYQTEVYAKSAYEENNDRDDGMRRSLYEGVNCMSVSARTPAPSGPSRVQHDARLTLRLRVVSCYSLLVVCLTTYIKSILISQCK